MRVVRSQPSKLTSRAWAAFVAFLAACAAVVAVSFAPAPAQAETHTSGNPWVFQETDASRPGLQIMCAQGQNGQCLEIKDYLDQPIAGANRAGAALWVAGDNFIAYGENDIFNWRFKVDPENPQPLLSECHGLSGIENRVFIGVGNGAGGGIYQCKVGAYGFYWATPSMSYVAVP